MSVPKKPLWGSNNKVCMCVYYVIHVTIAWTEKWHTVRKGMFTVRNLHLISGATEGIYGLSIRTDRKDRKLVCLRSVNCMPFT